MAGMTLDNIWWMALILLTVLASLECLVLLSLDVQHMDKVSSSQVANNHWPARFVSSKCVRFIGIFDGVEKERLSDRIIWVSCAFASKSEMP